MKHAQIYVFVSLLPVLAVSGGCADSPTVPSHLEQIASVPVAATAGAGGPNESSVDALLLSEATPQQATCTVELQKTDVFDPEKGKEGDWVPYDGSVLEFVAPEHLYFRYELKVNIPAKHYVTFHIEKSLLQPATAFTYPRFDKWKPNSLNGELAGNKSVQLDLNVPKRILFPGRTDEGVDVLGNTFEITTGWVCKTGLADEVSHGTLGTFKFKGVEKKKKKER